QSDQRPPRALYRRPCRPHRRLAQGDRRGAALRAQPTRRPTRVPPVPCLARGRRDPLGQSRGPASRHLLRHREVQPLHAGHRHRRRSADGAAIRMAEPSKVPSPPDGMPDGLPRILAVATITIGLTMSVLANSMTNLALPYIAHDLNISAESSIWIVNAS